MSAEPARHHRSAAPDWQRRSGSLALGSSAAKCVQIHRSDRYKAHEDTISKVLDSPVDFRPFYELKAIHGDERLESVTIFDNRSGVVLASLSA